MINTHKSADLHAREMARVSIVPMPWDAPQTAQTTPIGRMCDTPQISAVVAKPRIVNRAPDTFCNHDEDALRLMMQRLDGVTEKRFPPKVAPKGNLVGRPKKEHTKNGSRAEFFHQFIAEHGKASNEMLREHFQIDDKATSNALALLRKRGLAVYCSSTRMWSLT